jgi:hypothetical protein
MQVCSVRAELELCLPVSFPNDNHTMMRFFKLALLGCILTLSACSPALNWREVRMGPDASVKALLPCKPDQASRPIALAGQNVELHMQGCEAAGMLFAVSWVSIQESGRAQEAQTQWQAGMLSSMQARSVQALPINFKGATGPGQAVRVMASGTKPDGQPVQAQGLWLVRGNQVFHAAMYGEALASDAVDAFFSGIELQP